MHSYPVIRKYGRPEPYPVGRPEPEETDPKPKTEPWPGDDIKTPDDSDPDTKIPLVQ